MDGDANFSKPHCSNCRFGKNLSDMSYLDEHPNDFRARLDRFDVDLERYQRCMKIREKERIMNQDTLLSRNNMGDVKYRFAAPLDQYKMDVRDGIFSEFINGDMARDLSKGCHRHNSPHRSIKSPQCLRTNLPSSEFGDGSHIVEPGASEPSHSCCRHHVSTPPRSFSKQEDPPQPSTSQESLVKTTRRHKPHCARCISKPKFKKFMHKKVQGRDNDVRLLVVNKGRPVILAEIVRPRQVSSSSNICSSLFGLSNTDSGISQDYKKSDSETFEAPSATHNDHPNFDDTTKATPKTADDKDALASPNRRPDVKYFHSQLSDAFTQMTPKADDETRSWKTVATPSSASASGNPARKVYRAKHGILSSRISSCLSRHSGKNQVTGWKDAEIECHNASIHVPKIPTITIDSNGSNTAHIYLHRKKNKTDLSSDERNKMLKEAIPSILASSEAESLEQLKQQVADYVTYLAGKVDEDPASTAAGVKPKRTTLTDDEVEVEGGSRRLIRAVSDPFGRLSSDVTTAVTRSVTDAIIKADDAVKPDAIDTMLKLGNTCAKQVTKELQNLFSVVKMIESYTSLKGSSS